MKPKYLRKEEIELAAAETLDSYGRRFGVVSAPPVPVEEILECDLKIDFGLEDLRGGGMGDDVLGAFYMRERKVRVDSSLDPTLFPDKEGRFRFTVAHEVGHWQLHRHLFLEDANQDSLFEESAEPSVVCRSGYNKPSIEWQADAFAGHLLMPRAMVVRAWEEVTGEPTPRVVNEVGKVAAFSMKQPSQCRSTFVATCTLAQMFGVSRKALWIRLTDLGLVRDHSGGSSLFA